MASGLFLLFRRNDVPTLATGWRWCAHFPCGRIFVAGEGCGYYCSRTCSRAADRLREDPDKMERALEINRTLDKTDVFDRAAMLRALRLDKDGK